MNRQLIEVASWRLVSEIIRRYPEKYTVIQTYPGGGMYDCLSLYTKKDHLHIADLNREGSFHVFLEGAKSSFDIWQMMFNTHDLKKDILNRVSEALRMPVPAKLPPSTPEILCYRFIATFLSHTAFTRDNWRCRNGFFDSSAPYECGGEIKDFEKFPGAIDRGFSAKMKIRIYVWKQPAMPGQTMAAPISSWSSIRKRNAFGRWFTE